LTVLPLFGFSQSNGTSSVPHFKADPEGTRAVGQFPNTIDWFVRIGAAREYALWHNAVRRGVSDLIASYQPVTISNSGIS
jgi:hypothetical protein